MENFEIPISNTLFYTGEPVIYDLNVEIKKLKAKGLKVYDFGQALINLPPPQTVTHFLGTQDWTDLSLYSLSPVPGLYSLRERIAEYRQKAFSEPISAANVLITNGGNQANMLALKTIADPGDHVALISPYFFNHAMCTQIENLNCIHYEMTDKMALDIDALKRDYNATLKALLFANPANPSGKILSETELRNLIGFSQDKKLPLIVDESYLEFQPGPYNARYINDKTILTGSFSKSLCLPGMRIGYIIAPEHLVTQMIKIQDASQISANTIGQLVVEQAISGIKDHVAQLRIELRARKQLLLNGLKELNFFTDFYSDVDLFLFTKLPESVDMLDVSFAQSLLEKTNIAVMACNVAGSRGHNHLRWSIGYITLEDIWEALTVLKAHIGQLKS